MIKESSKQVVDSEGNPLTEGQISFFANSKVRDAKGNLLVVYHGTGKSFDTFKRGDLGFHFGTKEVGDKRKNFYSNNSSWNVKAYYLNIENPIVYDDDLGDWSRKAMEFVIELGLIDGDKVTRAFNKHTNKQQDAQWVKNELLKLGYDGIIYTNKYEDITSTSTSYIAFQANQIKAISNKEPNPLNKNINEAEDNLEVKPLTKEVILEMVKEEFTSDDSRPEDADSYLLPDGTFIEMFSDVEIDEKNKNYITNPSQTSPSKHVDLFLNSLGIANGINRSITSRSLFFESLTGSIAIYSSPYEEETHIYLNKKEPTEKQYIALNETISSAISVDSKLIIGTSDNKEVSQKELQGLAEIEIVNLIKSFYNPGIIKESIVDHREIYKSLTFSDNPERGPIFISREGKFANIGRFVTHAKIFDGQDYEGDDYYALHDAYDLIKANGGNKFEPFAYIDLWKIPNPAQKKAIISWMYYLLEWGMYTLQVNTSSSNETHNLTNKIPEEIYDDIVRNI